MAKRESVMLVDAFFGEAMAMDGGVACQ